MASTCDTAPPLSDDELVEPLPELDLDRRDPAVLIESGVDLSGEQQTKTRKALEFFSRRLRAG